MISLLRCLRNPRFRRTRREGILSFTQGRRNETKKDHRTQQSPYENDWLPRNENPHGRTSGDEERLTITAIILRNKRTPFLSLRLFFLVLCASSRIRESTFQISRQIHVLRRDVNRYVQTSFAAQISAQFIPRGTHESSFSRHGHA